MGATAAFSHLIRPISLSTASREVRQTGRHRGRCSREKERSSGTFFRKYWKSVVQNSLLSSLGRSLAPSENPMESNDDSDSLLSGGR